MFQNLHDRVFSKIDHSGKDARIVLDLNPRPYACPMPIQPLVMSPLGFKDRVGSRIYTWWGCICYTFPERFISLVWHLLTSWWPVWQTSHSLLYTCKQVLVWLKTGIYHATGHSQYETRQVDTLPTELCWLGLNGISLITLSYPYWKSLSGWHWGRYV